ncbi:hypothetical protein, partial [Serratia marcescens]|uniref:hypothetical protein n=1 Tax=Serratia marcescens TaxID=615 RepID=UPI00195400CF
CLECEAQLHTRSGLHQQRFDLTSSSRSPHSLLTIFRNRLYKYSLNGPWIVRDNIDASFGYEIF